MKHGVIQRAVATQIAHVADDRPDSATGSAGPSPLRRGRAVSEAIVSRFVTAFDGIAIFGAGIVAMQWRSATVDWRLEGLVVLLGSLLGLNFLHLAGADRFNQFADLGTSIGRALLGWLLTLGALFLAAPLVEPLTAVERTVDRPLVLRQRRAAGDWPRRPAQPDENLEPRRAPRRGRRHRRRRADRATPAAQHECARRAARAFSASTTTRRPLCRGDCMGHAILGSVDQLVQDVRVQRHRHRHRRTAVGRRSPAGRDAEQAQPRSRRREALPRRICHASRHAPGEPHRRAHLSERHRSSAARLAVDRQVRRGPRCSARSS